MRDVLPDEVFSEIADHIRERIPHAEGGWSAGEDEEDTLTGELGGALRTRRTYEVETNRAIYRWRIDYKKFRSKSIRSVEKPLGADGIFQIEFEDLRDGSLQTKGLLFQAKNQWRQTDGKLLEQTSAMERFLPNASAVFEYRPDGFRACESVEVIRSGGSPRQVGDGKLMALGDFLVDQFMECKVGMRGAYFDAARKVLIIPNRFNSFDERRFELKTRFRVEVKKS